MPLERDHAHGKELFLRLPSPHSEIIITPPRPSDVEDQVEGLNDLNVAQWLQGPPYPYTIEDSKEWTAITTKTCAEAEASYEKLMQGDGSMGLESAPVCIIREEDPKTGVQKYLGAIGIRRAAFEEIPDEQERTEAKMANDALKAGDEAIVWSIGGKQPPCSCLHWLSLLNRSRF